MIKRRTASAVRDTQQSANDKVAGVEGFEPPTVGFGVRCSSQLSHTPTNPVYTLPRCYSNNSLVAIAFHDAMYASDTRDNTSCMPLVRSADDDSSSRCNYGVCTLHMPV
jgi:hypothetical protein